jgi:hypothetical protein
MLALNREVFSPKVSRSQTYWFRLQGGREQGAEEKIRLRKWDLKRDY